MSETSLISGGNPGDDFDELCDLAEELQNHTPAEIYAPLVKQMETDKKLGSKLLIDPSEWDF